jgi:hypothetical protein
MNKNVRTLLIGFLIAFIVVNFVINLFINIALPHPLENYYSPGNPSLYLFLSSLIFLPAYLVAGGVVVIFIRIEERAKDLLIAGSIWAGGLSLLWALFLVFSLPVNPEVWALYGSLNVPAGWALGAITKFSDYLSPVGLAFTILPPTIFMLAVFLVGKVKWLSAQKA